MLYIIRVLVIICQPEIRELSNEERTARIFIASKTLDQSLFEHRKADHGMFLTNRPSLRTVVIGPNN
jgi:hypothetical protein